MLGATLFCRTLYFPLMHLHACSLVAGSATGSSAGIVFTHDPILGFSPLRGDTLHHQGEIWQGGGPLLPAKYHLDRLRGGGLRPPKLKKWNVPLRGRSLAQFL